MLELINDAEQDLIQYYISSFGPINHDSLNRPMASLDTIFAEWENSKTTLFNMLGNQLIVRRPYTYVIPEQNLIDTFTSKKYDNDCWVFLCWWNREIIAPLTNQNDIDPDFV